MSYATDAACSRALRCKLCGPLRAEERFRTDHIPARAADPARLDNTTTAAVELYWIPLGAGGNCVRFNGRVYEALVAARERRRPCALYHAALVIHADGDRYAVEIAPSPDADEVSRGVVGTGAVGSRHLGRLRLFRYEVRRGVRPADESDAPAAPAPFNGPVAAVLRF